MPGHKLGRVTEDVSRELSAILRELKDPRVTGFTMLQNWIPSSMKR